MSEAISRAELETYDRDELIECIAELANKLEDERQQRIDAIKTAGEDRAELRRLLNEHSDRINELENNQQRIESRFDDSDGKSSKVAEIVRFAANARSEGQPAIKLTAKDIKGATGCSRRYAYDLMDDLPTEYDWFLTPQEMKQYGSLEIDNSGERRLGVDFEGVHSSGVPLNKFTTRNGREGEE